MMKFCWFFEPPTNLWTPFFLIFLPCPFQPRGLTSPKQDFVSSLAVSLNGLRCWPFYCHVWIAVYPRFARFLSSSFSFFALSAQLETFWTAKNVAILTCFFSPFPSRLFGIELFLGRVDFEMFNSSSCQVALFSVRNVPLIVFPPSFSKYITGSYIFLRFFFLSLPFRGGLRRTRNALFVGPTFFLAHSFKSPSDYRVPPNTEPGFAWFTGF